MNLAPGGGAHARGLPCVDLTDSVRKDRPGRTSAISRIQFVVKAWVRSSAGLVRKQPAVPLRRDACGRASKPCRSDRRVQGEAEPQPEKADVDPSIVTVAV